MKRVIRAASRVRFLRFAVVGVCNTLLDFMILNTLMILAHATVERHALIVGLNIVSASTTVIISFFLNRKFVFNNGDSSRLHHKLMIFMVITLTGLFVVQGAVFALLLTRLEVPARFVSATIEQLGFDFATPSFIQANTTKALATVATMLWNYVLYKRFVFKELEIEEESLEV